MKITIQQHITNICKHFHTMYGKYVLYYCHYIDLTLDAESILSVSFIRKCTGIFFNKNLVSQIKEENNNREELKLSLLKNYFFYYRCFTNHLNF